MTTDPTNVLQLEPGTDKREAIEHCLALKKMPHVYEKVKKLWGFPAFFSYVDNLMLMEPGREERQGFPEDVYREIDALDRLFAKYPDEVSHPSLVAYDREEIKQLIKDRSIKINYTVGDRR